MKTLLKQQLDSRLTLVPTQVTLVRRGSYSSGQNLFRGDLGSSKAEVHTRTLGLSNLVPAPEERRGPTSPKGGEWTDEVGKLRKAKKNPSWRLNFH